ncbi:hypothetical protein [Desertimonas flava]|uniref:hypothetical protein n=1 Tax=Desertimonas flava TaxID=2064846 RepID=UPI0013C50F2A|nr:hypothetical protein [Desertimonas flava]
MSALRELMAEHFAAPFPTSVEKGRDYGEVDAVMIGADIYGWALRAQGGGLLPIDGDRLRAARDALARSLLAFPDDAQPYYTQLVALADAALE